MHVLEDIAIKADVKEGKEKVRLLLREIFRNGNIGTKSLSRRLLLPIPTVAAIRKELENIGLIDRVRKGAILTEKGLKFVQDDLGLEFIDDLICDYCDGTGLKLPANNEELFAKIRDFMDQRPQPLTTIDQAFGKPITALRRALLLMEKDDVENRNILLLGDDDFTSLAISLIHKKATITVLDIDERLLEVIRKIALENGFKIKCIKHDLRKPLPKELIEKYDIVLTDPPYTIPGLTLFLSRAIQALKNNPGKKIYLAFAHRAADDLLDVQKTILDLKLVIQQILPAFNLYEGAEIHGNCTSLSILETTAYSQPLITNDYTEGIYTGELNPTIRVYKCINNHLIEIGQGQKIITIEELKDKGCPICNRKEKFVLIESRKLKN